MSNLTMFFIADGVIFLLIVVHLVRQHKRKKNTDNAKEILTMLYDMEDGNGWPK